MSSDRRREHPPELRARLVAEMMAGGGVSAVSRREGICTSVLHRWQRRARREAGPPVAAAATRLLPVRIAPPAEAVRPVPHPAPMLELVLGNGRVLRIPPGADPAAVAGLAAALER
jgi:transposase